MPSTNYYEILEVSPDASPEVIRAAYRSLSGTYHPDKDTSPEGRRRFQQIQEASDVLSDPVRRQEYDRTLGNDRPRHPVANSVVMQTNGNSSFLTLTEHLKPKGTDLRHCDLQLDFLRILAPLNSKFEFAGPQVGSYELVMPVARKVCGREPDVRGELLRTLNRPAVLHAPGGMSLCAFGDIYTASLLRQSRVPILSFTCLYRYGGSGHVGRINRAATHSGRRYRW